MGLQYVALQPRMEIWKLFVELQLLIILPELLFAPKLCHCNQAPPCVTSACTQGVKFRFSTRVLIIHVLTCCLQEY